MKQVIAVITVAFLLWVSLSESAVAGDRAVDLTIVYSNNINGYVQPCPT